MINEVSDFNGFQTTMGNLIFHLPSENLYSFIIWTIWAFLYGDIGQWYEMGIGPI